MDEVKVTVKCPKCNKRVFDKVKGASGLISIKCPHCSNVVEVDLSLRRTIQPYFGMVRPRA